MPNRTIPFINVPHAIFPAKTPSDAIRALLATALAEGLPVHACDTDAVERKTIFMPPVLDAKVQALAERHAMGYQDAVAALVTAALAHIAQKRGQVEAAKSGVHIPFEARAGQDVFFRSIMASVQADRICLAEASTGIGKSRSLVAAAIAAALGGKRPVVIAAPTLAVLGGSLWMEYEHLHATGLGRGLKVRFFPGSSEFIDNERLSVYLAEAASLGEPVDQAVREWLNAGGPNRVDTPLAMAMRKAGHPLCWLMSDLRDLATELDPAEFALASGKPSAEIAALLGRLRADAADADIVFCTHAMLLMGHMSSWAWFPLPSALLVDEAHLFEGIAASICSERLSIYSLRHSARVLRKAQGQGPASAAGKLQSALNALIEVLKSSDEGIGSGIHLRQNMPNAQAILLALDKVSSALAAKALAKHERIGQARAALVAVRAAMNGEVNCYGRIEFSPDRRFPSILAGKRSIAARLGGLWKCIEGGVVLASATLSTPDEFGNAKFDYLAGLLALPASRLDAPNPVVAPWIKSIPTLHTPRVPENFSRPVSLARTAESEAAWLARMAGQMANVAQSAKGGTMVLLTSYAQAKALQALLGAQQSMGDRVLTQSPDEKFASCEARFRSAHKAGKRPVLLALGVAWTGVDLSDKEVSPDKDLLLSDLVIGCLPIGLNRSSTMAARIEAQGTYPIVNEALMTLQQGLGRAVRSEGAANKNIWMMDGRIWSDWPGMKSLQQSARRILGKYQKQKIF